jgi:hypothetical protein
MNLVSGGASEQFEAIASQIEAGTVESIQRAADSWAMLSAALTNRAIDMESYTDALLSGSNAWVGPSAETFRKRVLGITGPMRDLAELAKSTAAESFWHLMAQAKECLAASVSAVQSARSQLDSALATLDTATVSDCVAAARAIIDALATDYDVLAAALPEPGTGTTQPADGSAAGAPDQGSGPEPGAGSGGGGGGRVPHLTMPSGLGPPGLGPPGQPSDPALVGPGGGGGGQLHPWSPGRRAHPAGQPIPAVHLVFDPHTTLAGLDGQGVPGGGAVPGLLPPSGSPAGGVAGAGATTLEAVPVGSMPAAEPSPVVPPGVAGGVWSATPTGYPMAGAAAGARTERMRERDRMVWLGQDGGVWDGDDVPPPVIGRRS